MKVVILAGGLGSRISEESTIKPNPMVEIGGMPILWHIMKVYSHYGFNEFIICAGYKQHVIKEWFADYYLYNSDVTFDFTRENQMTVHPERIPGGTDALFCTGLSCRFVRHGCAPRKRCAPGADVTPPPSLLYSVSFILSSYLYLYPYLYPYLFLSRPLRQPRPPHRRNPFCAPSLSWNRCVCYSTLFRYTQLLQSR